MRPTLLLIPTLSLLLASCVSNKKFLEAENGRLNALNHNKALMSEVGTLKIENSKLTTRVNGLMKDTTEMRQTIRQYERINTANMSEQQKLNALLQQQVSELEARASLINELRNSIEEQQRRVANLLSSVQDALMGFSSDELTVELRNGKVYVSMSDKLLFRPGSAQVDKRGKEAIGKLAEVLNKQTEIDVYIEGHTDSNPINTVQFKDNWDLSVVRATSVVRILTKEYGVNPLQIIPSGRGEFMPVAPNESTDGRARNRRTEIIMAPKYEKLFDILQQD